VAAALNVVYVLTHSLTAMYFTLPYPGGSKMNRCHAISRHLAFCAVAGKEVEPDAVTSDAGRSVTQHEAPIVVTAD
jgi:hypothetical protein